MATTSSADSTTIGGGGSPRKIKYRRVPQSVRARIARTLPVGRRSGGGIVDEIGEGVGVDEERGSKASIKPQCAGSGKESLAERRGKPSSPPPRFRGHDVQHRGVRSEDEGPRRGGRVEVPGGRCCGSLCAGGNRRNCPAGMGENVVRSARTRDDEARGDTVAGPQGAHRQGPRAGETPSRNRRRQGPF